MPLTQLDRENANVDLTTQQSVLTHIPNTTDPVQCIGYVVFGDGIDDLDGSGGVFELTIEIEEQVIQPDPQEIIFSNAVRAGVWTTIFPVPAGHEVIFKARSPNTDPSVDVTAYLFEISTVTQQQIIDMIDQLELIIDPNDLAAALEAALEGVSIGKNRVVFGRCGQASNNVRVTRNTGVASVVRINRDA